MIILSPSQFDYQLFRTLLAQYARSFNITVVSVTIIIIIIIPIIIIVIVIIIIGIIIVIIRENVAVVNVFLDAPQTQILDVNEKTSIIDAVKYGDKNDFFAEPDSEDDFAGFQCWRSSRSLHGFYFCHGHNINTTIPIIIHILKETLQNPSSGLRPLRG